MDILEEEKALDQHIILEDLFNVTSIIITVITLDREEIPFRVSKHKLINTYFPNRKPHIDADGTRWYAISQYPMDRINYIELYMSPQFKFKIYYNKTQQFQEVKDVNF